MSQNDEVTVDDLVFWEEVSVMDPGPAHVRARRRSDSDGPVALGAVLYEGILNRHIDTAFDEALRVDMLSRLLSGDTVRRELGLTGDTPKTAC